MPKIKALSLVSLLVFGAVNSYATDLIPLSNSDNLLYYRIGGGSNYSLPPSQDTQTINLSSSSDLSAGYSCGAFNPLTSIKNEFDNLKNSVDNIKNEVIQNVTGSLSEVPMYALAQADPDLYNMLNNTLLAAHAKMDVSEKSCQVVKNEINQGKDPYKDWATISINNQWKQHLGLTFLGKEDINDAKKTIDSTAGDNGVPWVQGVSQSDGTYAGGKGQPPVRVIADTVKAGYNALLNRDLTSDSPAPSSAPMSTMFATPAAAQAWITNVVGDQIITTCTDSTCHQNQGGVAGRGLLPWITTCSAQNPNCADHIRDLLGNLVSGKSSLTEDNLAAVSTSGIMISPQVITTIRSMNNDQQSILVNKLAQEVATQKVMNEAFLARNILQTGAQVPVIASNQPAQKVIDKALAALQQDLQSLVFESQTRKQMVSNTVSEILNYQQQNQAAAVAMPQVKPTQPLVNNGAVATGGRS